MANRFGLFFTREQTVIRLPVNPEKLPVVREADNSEYNVLGIGQIMAARTPKLRKVTISSYFPGREFSEVLTAGRFEPPEFYLRFFEAAMKDKVPVLYTPVRYYEDGEPFLSGDMGFPVLVAQFTTEERGGETGDFYYDLTLTEYRDYAPQRMQVQKNEDAQAVKVTTEPARAIPQGQLYVRATAIMNGPYYYSSYGDEPHGNGNGRTVCVSRLVTTDPQRAYPVHVTTAQGGALGWVRKDSLQVVSSS